MAERKFRTDKLHKVMTTRAVSAVFRYAAGAIAINFGMVPAAGAGSGGAVRPFFGTCPLARERVHFLRKIDKLQSSYDRDRLA